ncbi:protein FAM200B-like [Palaemon carinicauda]|uniref:protein FAM200B-like n=1 Tax=Palaemon carinicauda TaxID=392227 RepID=UPI0035B5F411
MQLFTRPIKLAAALGRQLSESDGLPFQETLAGLTDVSHPSQPTDTFCQFYSNYVAMSAKKRKYNEDYIRFGFVSLRKGDTEVPQCVICYKTLSNDGMRPSCLERHLQTAHPGLVDKPKAFFETKKNIP